MKRTLNIKHNLCRLARSVSMILISASVVLAQQPPYDVFPAADPPYYRVRYEASTKSGELIYPLNATMWIPPGVEHLRGVIVHQHGCGEGSCQSGLTGAYDLHWQSLARKHDCALIAPAYEQPEKADCQMWCDPRNGSGAARKQCQLRFLFLCGMECQPDDVITSGKEDLAQEDADAESIAQVHTRCPRRLAIVSLLIQKRSEACHSFVTEPLET